MGNISNSVGLRVYAPTKINKNSIDYYSEQKGISPPFTKIVKAVKLQANLGIDLYLRSQSNWRQCPHYYFRQSQHKGVYHGRVKVDGKNTLVILYFVDGDNSLNIIEYKPGFYPNKATIARMVQRLVG